MSKEISNSNIVEFFRNSTVLLTGGTGFIGKLLTSKLLLTCQVSRIYLLIRKKPSKSTAERMRELFDDPIFIKLRDELPDCMNRIKMVEGDFSHVNLGISATEEETLCESVNFVVNCAAAMNMMGSFKKSVTINIRGTQQLVNLANKMTNLRAFVHLSTLSAFWEQDTIEEKLYKSHIEYEECLQLLKLDPILPMDKQDTNRIVGKKHTMYGFTKAASENIFLRENISVPVVIFRVSIALPCWKEPIPGWSNNYYGPSGMYLMPLLGVTPCLYWAGSTSSPIDIVPGDLVANGILAATSYSYHNYHKSHANGEEISPFVYNFTSYNNKNSLKFGDAFSYGRKETEKFPIILSNKIVFILWNFFFGYLPPLILDYAAFLLGKNYSFAKAYRDVIALNFKLTKHTGSDTKIIDENVQNCWKNLSSEDKKLFLFDLNEVVWDDFIPRAAHGGRRFVHKLLEKYESLRLAAFWVPTIRIIFAAIYFTFALYFVSSLYSRFS